MWSTDTMGIVRVAAHGQGCGGAGPAAAAALTGGWMGRITAAAKHTGRKRQPVCGDSNASASQLAGFLWEVIGRQK